MRDEPDPTDVAGADWTDEDVVPEITDDRTTEEAEGVPTNEADVLAGAAEETTELELEPPSPFPPVTPPGTP